MQDKVRMALSHMNLRSVSDVSGVKYTRLRHFRYGNQNLTDEDINAVITAIKELIGGIF